MQLAGDLMMMDAKDALAEFMVDGFPDAGRFAELATAALDRLSQGRSDCTIRAYGEMVDLLWKDGQTVAAVKLEMLWNQLAVTREFSLLCGYSMGHFYKDASMHDVCAQHTHIASAGGELAAVDPRASLI
jgi:MEDS: MEthanogen/methylotroph, DcmR Sensory domain